ncbi:peptidoglycan-binding protein [uncultured Streptomyces sp.]|uniref:peptidoglycan-binding domain-containing protein n=1 Tax=uncultured Streptomyces sp. TaxID=174707 RepID=UPI00261B9C52|nr:peptidoglycan-binding domain-containing protein [uncultured Streptomyces sp.]
MTPAGAPDGESLRAARDARAAAEIAAAEDFDPLRIRPYVTLSGGPEDSEAAAGHPAASGTPAADSPVPRTWMGAPLPPEAPTAVIAGARVPHPVPVPPATDAPDPVQPRSRKPFAVLGVAAALVAVVGTAAFLGGLFGGDDSQDQAVAETTATLPAVTDEETGTPTADPSATPSAPASASPSASASASASSASPSPSTSASASPTASTAPSASPSTAPSPTPSTATPDTSTPPALAPATGSTLQLGDQGGEVAELQNRLRAAGFYRGASDATYTERVAAGVLMYQARRNIQGDAPGTYGPHTRRVLEAETSGRHRD